MPRKPIWNVLADYANVADFHPNIVESHTLNGVDGLGGKRACDFGRGQGVEEEITTWEVESKIAFTGTRFHKLPMHRMVGTFTITGDGPTAVRFDLDYKMKGGFIMDLLARRMMKGAGAKMLDGLRTKL